MLPRPFPFPFLGNRAASPGLQSSFSIPAPGPVTRTDSALLCREQGLSLLSLASRVVFLSPLLAQRSAQTQPSPAGIGNKTRLPRPPGEFSFPGPGPVTRTVLAPPSWHWEQDPPPPAPRGVFFPRSWPNDPHRLNPSPLASGTGFSPRKVLSRSLGRLPVSRSPSGWASLCPFSCHAQIPWGISPGDLFRLV